LIPMSNLLLFFAAGMNAAVANPTTSGFVRSFSPEPTATAVEDN